MLAPAEDACAGFLVPRLIARKLLGRAAIFLVSAAANSRKSVCDFTTFQTEVLFYDAD